jgi:hypothetical protein
MRTVGPPFSMRLATAIRRGAGALRTRGKALAVDPAERYETVADLAQDLRRYLRHEPVTAQAQTIRYRTQKFVKRHRGGVLAASLTALALVAEAAAASGNTRWIAQHQLMRGLTLARMGRGAEAGDFLAAAEAIYLETAGANERLLDEIALARARILLTEGDAAAARAAVDEVLSRAGYPQRKDAPGLSSMLWTASQVALGNGDAMNAEQYANDGFEVAVKVARDPAFSGDVGQLLLLRAKARHAQGDRTATTTDLELAIPSLIKGFGEAHPETVEAKSLLALAGS